MTKKKTERIKQKSPSAWSPWDYKPADIISNRSWEISDLLRTFTPPKEQGGIYERPVDFWTLLADLKSSEGKLITFKECKDVLTNAIPEELKERWRFYDLLDRANPQKAEDLRNVCKEALHDGYRSDADIALLLNTDIVEFPKAYQSLVSFLKEREYSLVLTESESQQIKHSLQGLGKLR